MAAKYDIDISCLMYQHLIFFYSKMRQTNYSITPFHVFQLRSHLIRHRYGIFEHYAFALIGLYEPLHFCTKPEYSYFQPVTFQYNVRLHKTFEHSTLHAIIGTNDWKISHLKQTRHVFQTKIELMITDSGCIVLHQIQHFNFHLSLKKVIIGCTLREVSAVEH